MASSAATCPAPSPTSGAAMSYFNAASTLMLASSCWVAEPWLKNADDVPDQTWVDYIVIGAGTAGSVVASRLSEDGSTTVLLLEHGGPPPMESIIPSYANKIGKSYQYNFTFTGTKVGAGLVDKAPLWSRSRMLGGSSSANNMAYLKGVEHDYRQWYEAGNDEWHPDSVKKYFKKAENLRDATLLADAFASDNYGTGGPLAINKFNSTKAEISQKVLSAYAEIGIKQVPDLNTANLMGCGTFPALVANGQRVSTATAYLDKAQSNLKMAMNTIATKILIDKETKLAYGVEALQNGKKVTFFANNEIILSAGAIYSPVLLMVSGIGPEKALLSHKIDYIVSSPGVGQNLQTLASVPLLMTADKPGEKTELENAFNAMRYLYDRTGSLADLATSDVTAFYAKSKESTYPDFQSLLGIFNKNSTDSSPIIEAYIPTTADALKALAAEKALFMFDVVTMRPKSKGTVTISSSNAEDDPVIHHNIFKDPKDLDNAVQGLKMLSKLTGTAFFKSINAKLAKIPFKDCDASAVDSAEYFKCLAMSFGSIAGNPVGTCRMGSDDKAVVDSRLVVRGMSGLRVVDESVMPTPPSSVSDAPIVMMAELAADLIKEDNGGDTIGSEKMVKKGKKAPAKKAPAKKNKAQTAPVKKQ